MKKGNVEYLKPRTQNPGGQETVSQQFEEAGHFIAELRQTLSRSERAFQGLKDQIDILERWMDYYRQRLQHAGRLSENGTALLGEIRNRLKVAAESLKQREEERVRAFTRQHAARSAPDALGNILSIFETEPKPL